MINPEHLDHTPGNAPQTSIPTARPLRILFVCLGNICRSPAAHGVMTALAHRAGKSHLVHIDSAGTSAHHRGELPDGRMRAHAARRGYELTHRSRPVTVDDFDRFDLIIGMDDRNIDALRHLAPTADDLAKIHRMTDFCTPPAPIDHVPDPYYGGSEGFEHVLDLLEDACARLLTQIR